MAHILVVEDDADVQSVVSEFLVTLGHRLTCASSAEEARLFLAKRAGRSRAGRLLDERRAGKFARRTRLKAGCPNHPDQRRSPLHRDVLGAFFSLLTQAISIDQSRRADRAHLAHAGDRSIAIVARLRYLDSLEQCSSAHRRAQRNIAGKVRQPWPVENDERAVLDFGEPALAKGLERSSDMHARQAGSVG